MCIQDNYVYQKRVLCFYIHESDVMSVRMYCFVRNYAAVPVELRIVILQYIIIIIIIIIIVITIIIIIITLCKH
jgi:hypothetical protein